MRVSCRTDQFIEFQLQRFAVAVLRVLNQEHHEKSYDGRAGVDDELPGVADTEKRARRSPDNDHSGGDDERPRMSRRARTESCEAVKTAAVGRTSIRRAIHGMRRPLALRGTFSGLSGLLHQLIAPKKVSFRNCHDRFSFSSFARGVPDEIIDPGNWPSGRSSNES